MYIPTYSYISIDIYFFLVVERSGFPLSSISELGASSNQVLSLLIGAFSWFLSFLRVDRLGWVAIGGVPTYGQVLVGSKHRMLKPRLLLEG
jgi:hypothetical protein